MSSLMVQGTSSGAGKTVLVAALCRIFADRGLSVAPFKAQNMSNFSYRGDGFEISRAQAVQAVASRCDMSPDLNPILLKPRGNYYSTVFLNGKRFQRMHALDYYTEFVKTKGMELVLESFWRLRESHDLVILEGAGSPAEINLTEFDIANMAVAHKTSTPVLLVSDIDRGGSFASIAGTASLLPKKHRKLIKGAIINKFRGDINILRPGFKKLQRITKIPVLGVVPMIRLALPDEDSLDGNAGRFEWNYKNVKKLDREIDKMARTVEKNLNIEKIARLVR